MIYVNEAWQKLTGFSSADAVGRSSRMLQGIDTEEDALAEISASIRERRSCTVKITNYKKSGETFLNNLSIHPVHDSRGVLRYSIGIISDNACDSAFNRAMLAAVRHLLPTSFPVSLNVECEERAIVGKAAQEHQFLHAMAPSIVQQLLVEREAGVIKALRTRQTLLAFWHFLNEAEQKQLQSAGLSVEDITADDSDKSGSALERANSFRLVTAEVAELICQLERNPFELFLHTKAGDVVAEDLVPSERLHSTDEVALFGYGRGPLVGHALPTDAAGWLRAFAMLAERMKVQIALSSVNISGNPLIYVNKAWCTNTGYSRDEVLGRNCRFLQGPLTEAAAVKQLVAALRDGTDACVRITNYRKSGEAFANLVVLRPVHDSNGVYRFCISMAVVLGEEVGLDERLWQLTRSMEFMPHSISYCNVRTPLTPRIRLP